MSKIQGFGGKEICPDDGEGRILVSILICDFVTFLSCLNKEYYMNIYELRN